MFSLLLASGHAFYDSTCNFLKEIYSAQLAKERHTRAVQILGGLSNQLRLTELYLSRNDDVTAKKYFAGLRDAADQLLSDARFNDFSEVSFARMCFFDVSYRVVSLCIYFVVYMCIYVLCI